MEPQTKCIAVATAVPEHRATQDQIHQFMANVAEANTTHKERPKTFAFLQSIYQHSGIDTRYSVLPDYLQPDPSGFEFFPPNWSLEPTPTTADRMKVYQTESLDLALQACTNVFYDSGIDPSTITHVIVCTCTGFFAPGLDIILCQQLGISPNVHRTQIGFMGCHAGFTGMRTADQIVRSDETSVVLQVNIELCSLHFQKAPVKDYMVANCLFADGCAAALYGSNDRFQNGIGTIRASHSHVQANSLHSMGWHIGDTGFEMRLKAEVPQTLQSQAEPFVQELLKRQNISQEDIQCWAIHPGGRKILEAIAQSLQIEPQYLEASYEVLRHYGNMSSATLFFVIERAFHNWHGEYMVCLGFGPGLTMEGVVLENR